MTDEREVVDLLRRLADKAPAAPEAAPIRRRLARRRAGRLARRGAAGLLLVAGIGWSLAAGLGDGSAPAPAAPRTGVVAREGDDAPAPPAADRLLDPAAGEPAIRRDLAALRERYGVTGELRVGKRPGEALSVAVAGTLDPAAFAELRARLAADLSRERLVRIDSRAAGASWSFIR